MTQRHASCSPRSRRPRGSWLRGGIGALALTVALSTLPFPVLAAEPDEPVAAAPADSMIVAVVVPEHQVPAGGTPAGSGQSSTARDLLADTGIAAGPLWAIGFAAGGALLTGTALVLRRRSRVRA